MSGQPPENPYGENPYGQNPYGQQPDPNAQQPGSSDPFTQPPAGDPYGQQPYGGAPQYGQQYGQQPAGAPPYGAAQYGAPQYGAPGNGMAPKHPSATTAMVLGLVGLIGGFVLCGLPLLLSPFAWAVGSRTVKSIDASGGAFSGRDQANVGKITGIIGTVLLVLGIIFLAIIIVVAINSDPSTYSTTTYDTDDF